MFKGASKIGDKLKNRLQFNILILLLVYIYEKLTSSTTSLSHLIYLSTHLLKNPKQN